MAADPTVPDDAGASASAALDEAEAMAALDRARLPVATLAEAIPHLRRPFSPAAIRFKVQSVFKGDNDVPTGCLIVAYIDQRLVTERLNRVIPGAWSAKYGDLIPAPTPREKNRAMMWCALTVDGITRCDIGESSKGWSKDLVSDALKRAAVPFGVGVSCYALPQIRLWMSESLGRIKVRGKGDKQTVELTEHGHVKLREGYSGWLETHGVQRFGPPLDHGDVVGVTIEEEHAIGEGEGDGSPPEWEGLPDEMIADIEAMLVMAEEFGWPLDVGTVRIRLNHRPEAVEAWLADTRDTLALGMKPEVSS